MSAIWKVEKIVHYSNYGLSSGPFQKKTAYHPLNVRLVFKIPTVLQTWHWEWVELTNSQSSSVGCDSEFGEHPLKGSSSRGKALYGPTCCDVIGLMSDVIIGFRIGSESGVWWWSSTRGWRPWYRFRSRRRQRSCRARRACPDEPRSSSRLRSWLRAEKLKPFLRHQFETAFNL